MPVRTFLYGAVLYGAVLLGLLSSPGARAECVVDSLQTELDLGPGHAPGTSGLTRRDRWAVYVGEGAVDCHALDLHVPVGLELERVRVRVRHADDTGPRFREERLLRQEASSEGPGAWRLHLPELRFGDQVELAVEWGGEVEALRWDPGTMGAVSEATLEVSGRAREGDLRALRGEESVGLEGRGPWSWTSLPARGEADALVVVSGEGKPSEPPRPELVSPESLVSHHEQLVLLPLDPRRPLQSASAGTHRRMVERVLSLPPAEQEGALFQAVPGGATPVSLTATLGDGELPVEARPGGWLVSLPASAAARQVSLRWVSEAPGLPTEGTWSPHQEWASAGSSFTVRGAEAAELSLAFAGAGSGVVSGGGSGDSLRFEAGASGPATPEGIPDGLGSWTLASVGERRVLPDLAAVQDDVAFYAILASLPEPAVGMRHKNQAFGDALLQEVLDEVKARIQPASWPGHPTLRPRKLLRGVRRSGWGSPWELALYGARLLKQLKQTAEPLPLRPASLGMVAHPAPGAFPEAVLRWQEAGSEPVYIDLSCRQCALGEVRPELAGAQVLAQGLPASTLSVSGETRVDTRVAEDGRVARVAHLEGSSALALREGLASVPAEERSAWVASRLGAARLARQEGLGERGAAVELTLEGGEVDLTGPLVTLPRVSTAGSSEVWLGPEGHQVHTLELEGVRDGFTGTLGVTLGGLRYLRTSRATSAGWLIEERLEQTGSVHERAAVVALEREVARLIAVSRRP